MSSGERVNRQERTEVKQANAALRELRASVQDLIGLLHPRDFEILVELVFSTSGWRKQGAVGGSQKTIDLDLMLPSTGEKAFVQVKSETSSAQLAEYVGTLPEQGSYDRMFYVYHDGEAATRAENVTVIGPERLAEMVVDAGLVNWLINKVS